MRELTDPYKPKYLQLVDIIRGQILSGELNAGDRLSSENDLKLEYGVSSTTVRKCIDILRSEGYIERMQGIGTFVKTLQVERSLQKILSFTKNMEQAGLQPSTDVLERRVIDKYGTYHTKLGLERGHQVLMIKRLRYGDGIPMMLEKRYINMGLCAGIIEEDISGSLYRIYEEVYGIRLASSKQHLRLYFLDSEEASLLSCMASTPAFLVTGTTFADNMVPLEYEESLYRGDKYEFFVDISNC
jgi:GntR family transcriptional regulator